MWPQKGLSPTEAAETAATAASSAFRSARNFFLNIATRNTRNNMATNSPTAPSRANDQNNTTQDVNQNPDFTQERTLVLEGLGQGYRAQTHSRRSQGTLKYQDAPHRVQSQNRAEHTPLSAAPLLPRGTSPLSSPLANSISSMLCAGEISQTSTLVIDPTQSIHQTSCQNSILRYQFHTRPSLLPRATSRIPLTSSPISSSISAPATTSSTQSTPLPPSISEGSSQPLPEQSSPPDAPLPENANSDLFQGHSLINPLPAPALYQILRHTLLPEVQIRTATSEALPTLSATSATSCIPMPLSTSAPSTTPVIQFTPPSSSLSVISERSSQPLPEQSSPLHAPLPENANSTLFQASNEETNPDESQNSRDLSLSARELETLFSLPVNSLDIGNFMIEEQMVLFASLTHPLSRKQKQTERAEDEEASFEPEQIDLQSLEIAIRRTESTFTPYVWDKILNSILDTIYLIEEQPIPSHITQKYICNIIARGLEISLAWTYKSPIKRRIMRDLRHHLRDIHTHYDAVCHPDLSFAAEIKYNLEQHTRINIQRVRPASSHDDLQPRSKTKIHFASTLTFIPEPMYDPLPQFNSSSAQGLKSILKKPQEQKRLVIDTRPIARPKRNTKMNTKTRAEQRAEKRGIGCLDDFKEEEDIDVDVDVENKRAEAKHYRDHPDDFDFSR